MTVKQALELIIENNGCPALSHAVNYAKYALALSASGQLAELRIQLLYVVSNIIHWRYNKNFSATAAEIKHCRSVLSESCK